MAKNACSCCASTTTIRVFAVLCFCIGIVQTFFGIMAYDVVEGAPWGAFWAGLFLAIASISGCLSDKPCHNATAMGCSIPAVIVMIVGGFIDAISFAYVNKLKACADSSDAYGNSDYQPAATLCYVGNSDDYDCSCVRETFAENPDADCYSYDTKGDDKCEAIIEDLPGALHVSFALCFIAACFAIAFSISACSKVCCKTDQQKVEQNAPLMQSQITSSGVPVPQQQYVYVAPTGAYPYTNAQPQPYTYNNANAMASPQPVAVAAQPVSAPQSQSNYI